MNVEQFKTLVGDGFDIRLSVYIHDNDVSPSTVNRLKEFRDMIVFSMSKQKRYGQLSPYIIDARMTMAISGLYPQELVDMIDLVIYMLGTRKYSMLVGPKYEISSDQEKWYDSRHHLTCIFELEQL